MCQNQESKVWANEIEQIVHVWTLTQASRHIDLVMGRVYSHGQKYWHPFCQILHHFSQKNVAITNVFVYLFSLQKTQKKHKKSEKKSQIWYNFLAVSCLALVSGQKYDRGYHCEQESDIQFLTKQASLTSTPPGAVRRLTWAWLLTVGPTGCRLEQLSCLPNLGLSWTSPASW